MQRLSQSDIKRLRDEIAFTSVFYLVVFGAIMLIILVVVITWKELLNTFVGLHQNAWEDDS